MQATMKHHFLTGWTPAPVPTGQSRLNPRVLGPRELLNPRTLLDLAVMLMVFTAGGGA